MQTSPSEAKKPRCPKQLQRDRNGFGLTYVPCPYVPDESGMCPMHAFMDGAYARKNSFPAPKPPIQLQGNGVRVNVTFDDDEEDEDDDDDHN